MANKLYEESNIQAVANAIRAKTGTTDTMILAEMPGKIESIETGGGNIDALIDRSVTEISSDTATSVGDYAFYRATTLADVNLSEVTSIGHGAFQICSALANINAPKVTGIGNYAFAFMLEESSGGSEPVALSTERASGRPQIFSSVLSTVNFPEVTSVGDYAFVGCTKLTDVNLPKLTTIGANVFAMTALTSADFPLVEEIGDYAFYYSLLTSANFPLAYYIGAYAFMRCSKLASINFPEVERISHDAFAMCSALVSIMFPKAIYVEEYSFGGCTALISADFPVAEYIYDSAFEGCTNLTVLILRNTTQKCSFSNALSDTPINSGTGYIYVPSALIDSYKTEESTYTDQFRALEDYTVDGTTTGELDESKI